MNLNILAPLTTLFVLINGITIRFIMSDFIKIFSKLGADLPSTTQYLLMSYSYWVYLLILPLIALIFSLSMKNMPKTIEKTFSTLLVLLIIFLICMQPIIYLGAFLPMSDLLNARVY